MTDDQKEFLRLHVINQEKYEVIREKLKVSKSTLSEWYEELREERNKIAKVRAVWGKKKFTVNFESFYNWYMALDRKCEYCGITESQIKDLLDKEELSTKRLVTRGRSLEFDRKNPNLAYNELANIVLSCYWCNNAKTDTFTYEEFKRVGRCFSEIWKERYRRALNKV